VTGRPLIQAREPPSARMIRRSWHWSSSSSSLSRSHCRAGASAGGANSADSAAVGAQPGQEAQRVHHQRLARAGFAADHGHARPEFEFGSADDCKILDR